MEDNGLEMEKKDSEKYQFEKLDDILPYVGEMGKYQIILLIMFSLMLLAAGFPILIMFFAAQNPPWTCVSNSTICNVTGSFTSKQKEYYAKRCDMPRSEWKFTKPKSYSIVTQFDIYCDTEYYIYLSTSLLFIGWGIGSIVLGWLFDRYGRFKVLLASVTGIILFNFLSSLSPNYAMFGVCRFVVGVFIPGIMVGTTIISGELVSPKHRPLTGAVLSVFFALSLMLTGVKAYFVREWKTLIMICSAPYSFVLLFFFYVPESMRWLRISGRHADVIAILKKAAKVNGKVLPDGIELTPLPETKIDKTSNNILVLFKTRKMLVQTAVQGFAWLVIAAVYYGVALAVSGLSGEMYRDYILASLIELPALFLSVLIMNRSGRKTAVVPSVVLSGIFCSIVGGLSTLSSEDKNWKIVRVVLGLIGKFCITMAFNSIYIWSQELYPTTIRGEGMGFLQITGRIGSALAPWVAEWLGVFHVAIPFSLMGVLSIFAAAALMLLPETRNLKTLETLDEITGQHSFKEQEDFGTSKSNLTMAVV